VHERGGDENRYRTILLRWRGAMAKKLIPQTTAITSDLEPSSSRRGPSRWIRLSAEQTCTHHRL